MSLSGDQVFAGSGHNLRNLNCEFGVGEDSRSEGGECRWWAVPGLHARNHPPPLIRLTDQLGVMTTVLREPVGMV